MWCYVNCESQGKDKEKGKRLISTCLANLTIYHLLTQLVSLLIFLVEVLQALGVEPVLQHGEGEVWDLIVDIFGLVPAAHDHMSTAVQDPDPPLII